MPGGNGRTKEELLNELDELREENESLQDRLDAVLDIVSSEEAEDEEGDED